MWWILGIIGLLLAGYLGFLIYDLKRYAAQLEFIVKHDTNQELQLQTRMPYLKKITLLNNQLLKDQKETRTKLVTETKHLEQAIHNISHDLRTPLTVANGYVQYVLTEKPGLDEQKAILVKMQTNLDAVNEHLEHLLDYQRINEQQLTLDLQKYDISRCLEEQVLALYHSFEERGFELEVNIEKQIELVTDQKVLTRIFQNVLGNMIVHGRKKGAISLQQQGDGVVFKAVNDVNETIKHPERLTERFYMEDLARQSKSSGVGLFIVKELVNELSGKLAIETDENTYELMIKFPRK